MKSNKDFQDMRKLKGDKAVLKSIHAAKPVTTKPSTEPTQKCKYGDGVFEVTCKGVYYTKKDKDGNDEQPIWICAPLYVTAKTRDSKGNEWGHWLEWHDDDKQKHSWAMPMELLQGDGRELRSVLARQGLALPPAKHARDLLATYLQVWPVTARARCVERLGWFGSVYVTPTESFGTSNERVVFQHTHALDHAWCVRGDLEQWRNDVARLAIGNSRLVFAISIAFSGVLLELSGVDSGGFHLRGSSSTGKTTAIKAGCSVWGNPDTYKRQWRATTNGLEGLAAIHNDGVLILDDIDQANDKEVGESAYLLANGQGKARASRDGSARKPANWRLLILSSGEHSLATILARAGKQATAGQEIRLADIEADAGKGMGLFENLHDTESPAIFAKTINDASASCYGVAGIEWIQKVVADRDGVIGILHDSIKEFCHEVVPRGSSGQVERVARRFALGAAAGELASEFGITGWEQGEAERAAKACFNAWLAGFGSGGREEQALMTQVRAFFEAHGSSRFEDKAGNNEQRILNRAGFYRTDKHGNREYLVLPVAFRSEICKGFDFKYALKTLLAAGWIVPTNDKENTHKPRLPGMGAARCYVFPASMWEGDA